MIPAARPGFDANLWSELLADLSAGASIGAFKQLKEVSGKVPDKAEGIAFAADKCARYVMMLNNLADPDQEVSRRSSRSYSLGKGLMSAKHEIKKEFSHG